MSQHPPKLLLVPKRPSVSYEVAKIDAAENTVHFLNGDGQEIGQGASSQMFEVPAGTKKIVANGNLKIAHDMPIGVESVFANGNITILGDSHGNITGSGDVLVVGTAHDDIAATGKVKCRDTAKIGERISNIKGSDVMINGASYANVESTIGDIIIGGGSHGKVKSAGNTLIAGQMLNDVTSRGFTTLNGKDFNKFSAKNADKTTVRPGFAR